MVQRMLVGKAHRAMHLMGDRGAGSGRLADPQLSDRDFGRGQLAAKPVAGDRLSGGIGGGAGGGDLARQGREVVLHRLEFRDRPAELHAVERELHRLVEDVFEGAGHLLRPRRRAECTSPNVSSAGAGPAATAVSPSKKPCRAAPGRLRSWLIASPSVATSATDGLPAW